jgi:sigma-B regulation protein RsbU (phosphoserine phosphatase)
MVYREIGSNSTPGTIMSNINRPMYYKTDKRVFTAMLFASIDVETKMLRFSNAGQTSPALKRRGEVQYLKMEGIRLPLGMKERIEYGEMEFQLHSGDVLVFCTDGLTEQMNEAEEVFGMYRLAETISMLDDSLSSRDMVARLFDQAQRYAGKATQHDDMTAVVIRVL